MFGLELMNFFYDSKRTDMKWLHLKYQDAQPICIYDVNEYCIILIFFL